MGAAYFWIEANSVPGQFTDSDIFDSRTNGKGWVVYVTKELLRHVDVGSQVYVGEPIVAAWPAFVTPPPVIMKARVRFQLDVILKF
jgi:hypothetical protein